MVECECGCFFKFSVRHAGFNRYMVECELGKGALTSVKALVLIDTWWNVNDFDIFRYANLFGFNRYMVECECVRSAPHA